MTKLRPFKEVQLQWLRLLLLDTELSARAFQFATYLAVWRYNADKKKAWPPHERVCEDLGLKSKRSVNRLIKELDGKWFDVKSGNGLGNATEYVPTPETHLAAQNLRAEEERNKRSKKEREKADNIVILPVGQGGHFCPERRSERPRQAGHKCPPNKVNKKIKEKSIETAGLRDQSQLGLNLNKTPYQKCPVNALVLIHKTDTEKVLAWNKWLGSNRLPSLEQLSIEGCDTEGAGYLMPRRWVPSRVDELGMVESYVLWAFQKQQVACQNV